MMRTSDSAKRLYRLGAALLIVLLLNGLALSRGRAQEATPTATAATSGIGSMLARAPAMLPDLEAPESALITYANLELQLHTTGVERPEDPAGEWGDWVGATYGLYTPMNASMYLRFWRDAYGFDLLQADETLEISAPPFNLTLFRGDFDEDLIRAKLDELGYAAIEVGGMEVLNLREDYEFSIADDPITGVFGSMNNAVFLPDGTLAFAPATGIIEAVIAVANGEAPSLAERVDLRALLPHLPDDLVSAMIVPGTMLATATSVVFPASEGTPTPTTGTEQVIEGGALPPIVSAVLGATAGAPTTLDLDSVTPVPEGVPASRAVVAALFLRPEDAEAAAPIIEERLETGVSQAFQKPFTEYFPERSIAAVPGERVVTIDMTLGTGSRPLLFQMLSARDLLFLAW